VRGQGLPVTVRARNVVPRGEGVGRRLRTRPHRDDFGVRQQLEVFHESGGDSAGGQDSPTDALAHARTRYRAGARRACRQPPGSPLVARSAAAGLVAAGLVAASLAAWTHTSSTRYAPRSVVTGVVCPASAPTTSRRCR